METLKHWKKKPRKTPREKASMFMDQNRENIHFTKDNLHIQWNPVKMEKKKNIKTHIEAQKIPDSKNNPEQKKKSFRNNFTPDFEFYYKCLVIKTSWDGHQSRHRDMQNGMENPDTRIHHHSLGKRQYLPPAVLGRLNISMQNNKIRSLPLTLHQSQLQMG